MNAELDHNELRGDRLGQMTNDSCFEEEEPFPLLSWRSRDGGYRGVVTGKGYEVRGGTLDSGPRVAGGRACGVLWKALKV